MWKKRNNLLCFYLMLRGQKISFPQKKKRVCWRQNGRKDATLRVVPGSSSKTFHPLYNWPQLTQVTFHSEYQNWRQIEIVSVDLVSCSFQMYRTQLALIETYCTSLFRAFEGRQEMILSDKVDLLHVEKVHLAQERCNKSVQKIWDGNKTQLWIYTNVER